MSKRIKFFFGHLSISLMIALIAIFMVFYIWYPAPLAKANSVSYIFIMMLAIDVVIGPLLILLVYKEKKRTLKFDLGVIILIQISAFLYGFHTIAQGRPAWLVFYHDRFDQVRAIDVDSSNLSLAQEKFRSIPLFGVEYAAVTFSADTKIRQEDTLKELKGITLAERPERYLFLDQITNQINEKSQSIKLLEEFNNKEKVESVLKEYPQANAWLPLKATDIDMVILINKNSSGIIGIVDLRPWKLN